MREHLKELKGWAELLATVMAAALTIAIFARGITEIYCDIFVCY